ncbi:unnamed protein product, partial [Oncorhynchus mykiss]
NMMIFCECGLSLWLVVWLVLGKPGPSASCPHLCVCYPTPMTVSCQAQNFTSVPVGVPYDSQRVFLQNNRITELRVGSFGFGTQVLWLFSNNITWIEAGSFSELRDLEELDLGDNSHLRRLEGGAFRGLEKLQSLHMHRCKLTALPHDLFHKLYSLQFLYLQENQLHFLQDDLFSDLINLSQLFLHGNRIRTLSENVFRGLVNLDRLLLHDNRVRQVNRRAFRDLGRLTMLFLFNNSLAELPGQALRDTQGIEFLRLNGNPWSCGCEALPLWEWFRGARVSSSELLCSSRPPAAGWTSASSVRWTSPSALSPTLAPWPAPPRGPSAPRQDGGSPSTSPSPRPRQCSRRAPRPSRPSERTTHPSCPPPTSSTSSVRKRQPYPNSTLKSTGRTMGTRTPAPRCDASSSSVRLTSMASLPTPPPPSHHPPLSHSSSPSRYSPSPSIYTSYLAESD